MTRAENITLLCCAAIGLIAAIATIARGSTRADRATPEYGEQLLAHTPERIAQNVGVRMACAACHLGDGAEPGTLSLATAFRRYPRTSPRSNANETIEDRINGCMRRSMNGRALSESSAEMRAMVSWLRFLSNQDAAEDAATRAAHEPPAFKTPNRAANPEEGRRVYESRCASCHGADGDGLAQVFPPLWGPRSFNDGAGTHRVLTAAKFIKGKMPLGRADLTDDEAFDVSGFINTQERPHMAGLEADYPDRRKKPVDTPYGPYADPFPIEQHRLGPFGPIEAFYRK
jgi:thiosulfate dehydrogenase